MEKVRVVASMSMLGVLGTMRSVVVVEVLQLDAKWDEESSLRSA